MCRWLVYKGVEVPLSALLTRPDNSLVNQSRNATYHPGCGDKRNMRVNGDGFGMAWYRSDKLEKGCCMFKSTSPAWSNSNLNFLAEFVETGLVFAHVRATMTELSDPEKLSYSTTVSEENCHPFKFKRYSFMHNGALADFPSLKRKIRGVLSDEVYGNILGNTDSEHAFGLLLNEIGDTDRELTALEFADAVERMINHFTRISRSSGLFSGSSLNFAVTDGRHVICTRCRNNTLETPPSLYYCSGAQCLFADKDDEKKATGVIISSEPLTRCQEMWKLVPKNHMLVVPHVDDLANQEREIIVRPMHIDCIYEETPQNKSSRKCNLRERDTGDQLLVP